MELMSLGAQLEFELNINIPFMHDMTVYSSQHFCVTITGK